MFKNPITEYISTVSSSPEMEKKKLGKTNTASIILLPRTVVNLLVHFILGFVYSFIYIFYEIKSFHRYSFVSYLKILSNNKS